MERIYYIKYMYLGTLSVYQRRRSRGCNVGLHVEPPSLPMERIYYINYMYLGTLSVYQRRCSHGRYVLSLLTYHVYQLYLNFGLDWGRAYLFPCANYGHLCLPGYSSMVVHSYQILLKDKEYITFV